jgi:hypothetical protein
LLWWRSWPNDALPGPGFGHAVVAETTVRREGDPVKGAVAAAEPAVVSHRDRQHVVERPGPELAPRSPVSGQAFGVTMTSAPPSMIPG